MPDFGAAIAAIDAANAADPNKVMIAGTAQPAALVYGRRMSQALLQLYPHADEPLRLAVRAQHLERFLRPRSDYPPGRDGYRRWRRDAAAYHAERLAQIMRDAGYGEAEITRAQAAVRKEKLKTNPDAQALEDCAALVFLQYEALPFLANHPEYSRAQVLSILRKTWAKMSPHGRSVALAAPLDATVHELVVAALQS